MVLPPTFWATAWHLHRRAMKRMEEDEKRSGELRREKQVGEAPNVEASPYQRNPRLPRKEGLPRKGAK